MALGEPGRNPLMPRSTAEGAASLRAAGALERDMAVRCPDHLAAGMLGGCNVTTLAKSRLTRALYVRFVNLRAPGAYPYEIARCRFIDEVTIQELAAGVDELVVLGAGLDSRPYRLAHRLDGVRVFEVDHPVSQAAKRARLRRLLGEEPRGVRFVGVDFTRGELATELARAGHDEAAATLFIWSGVSPFLPEPAVAVVLSWVGGHGSPKTSIAFDALHASVLADDDGLVGARELRASAERVGEPLRWGLPEGAEAATVERFGLMVERVVDHEAAVARYLTRSDGSVLGRPFSFGVLLHARARAARS